MIDGAIRFCTLASGSSGNMIYCDNQEGALLIDAGISCRQMEESLEAVGGDIDRVDGVVITHHHRDHLKGAGAICRRYNLPIFLTEGTLTKGKGMIGKVPGIRLFHPGSHLCLGGFLVETIPTPHDAIDPVALIIEHRSTRLGIFTDLGHTFDSLGTHISSLDALIIESNYDQEMLLQGPYPPPLKRRISGPKGHISNVEAAGLIRDFATPRLRTIILAHLSEKNNLPELALSCHMSFACDFLLREKPHLEVAPRFQPSRLFTSCRTQGGSN